MSTVNPSSPPRPPAPSASHFDVWIQRTGSLLDALARNH